MHKFIYPNKKYVLYNQYIIPVAPEYDDSLVQIHQLLKGKTLPSSSTLLLL